MGGDLFLSFRRWKPCHGGRWSFSILLSAKQVNEYWFLTANLLRRSHQNETRDISIFGHWKKTSLVWYVICSHRFFGEKCSLQFGQRKQTKRIRKTGISRILWKRRLGRYQRYKLVLGHCQTDTSTFTGRALTIHVINDQNSCLEAKFKEACSMNPQSVNCVQSGSEENHNRKCTRLWRTFGTTPKTQYCLIYHLFTLVEGRFTHPPLSLCIF